MPDIGATVSQESRRVADARKKLRHSLGEIDIDVSIDK